MDPRLALIERLYLHPDARRDFRALIFKYRRLFTRMSSEILAELEKEAA